MANLARFNGRVGWRPSRVVVLCTDACPTGWGFFLPRGRERGGEMWHPRFDAELLQCHVVFLETVAVLRSMQAAVDALRGRSVEVRVDNRWTLAYLRNGGGRREDLTRYIEMIWTFCVENEINLVEASWIPGKINSVADEESRWVDLGDWELRRPVFELLDQRWGPHTVDRMASAANAQVPVFNAWRNTVGAAAVDCFTQDWGKDNNFVCPPFALIERVLDHVEQEGAVATVVVPVWQAQPWWPKLMQMMVAHVVLPGGRNAFQRGPSTFVEPWKNKDWLFWAVRIGSSGEREGRD